MAQDQRPTAKATARRAFRLDRVTLSILIVCLMIESVLTLADLGILQPSRLRSLAYAYGGFWPGLLRNWVPNFPGQPLTMFLTYGFLHGGPVHLVVNMITLVSLGRLVGDRAGTRGYSLIYVASVLGGAAGFALLAPTLRPMVGASGALFGLLGALVVWEALDRWKAQAPLAPVVRLTVLLLILNLVLWWAMAGQLAWETHLGGFLAGGALALAGIGRRSDRPEDPREP